MHIRVRSTSVRTSEEKLSRCRQWRIRMNLKDKIEDESSIMNLPSAWNVFTVCVGVSRPDLLA